MNVYTHTHAYICVYICIWKGHKFEMDAIMC